MEDQLIRARGGGDDKLSNPHALHLRQRYGRTYYQVSRQFVPAAPSFRRHLSYPPVTAVPT